MVAFITTTVLLPLTLTATGLGEDGTDSREHVDAVSEASTLWNSLLSGLGL